MSMDALTGVGSATQAHGQLALGSATGVERAMALRATAMSDEEKLRMAAQEFEGYLVRTMLESMRETLPEGGVLPKSSGQQMFEGMLDDELSKNLSPGMGLGLSDAIVRQLSSHVENKAR